MKLQNSDLKTVADLGGDKTKLINDTQVYVAVAGINKRLFTAITDQTIGDSGLATINNPSVNTFDVSALPNDGNLVHTQAFSALYRLPSASSSLIKSYTFQHRGVSPTNSTAIIIDSTNNKIYFKRGATDYTATLASATYTLASMATEIASKMNAQDSNTYTCSFDMTDRNFKFSGAATWQFRFSSFTANTSAIVLAIAQEDSDIALKQQGFSFDNSVIIRPASGDKIRYRGHTVEFPGYIKLSKSGMSCRLLNIDNDIWVIDRVVGENHEKNSSIGFAKDIALVGRDTWITKATAGTARAGVGGFPLNGFGYICNGGAYSNEVNQYNDSANTWATKANGGTARSYLAGFSLNGFGYICNGYTGTFSNEVDQYNDGTNVWTSKAAGGTARNALSAFSLNGYGYICCGTNGVGRQNEVNKYNDNLNSWSTQATAGTAREGSAGFSLNGYGYVYDGSNGSDVNEVGQYNDSANTWINKNTGTLRRYLSAFSNNGFGYTCNGQDAGNSNAVDQYNDSTNSWTSKATGGTARNALSGFSLNSYGYIASGTSISGVTNEVNQYN